MARELIRGNGRLAERLGVTKRTVATWRKKGVLDAGTVSYFGRVIIYDLDKVLECLNHRSVCERKKMNK